jgi:hypothetical protein
MGKTALLICALGISVVGYILYRHTYFKTPKKKPPVKPNFTLKIESE